MKLCLFTLSVVLILEVIAIGELMDKAKNGYQIVEVTFWDHSKHQGENPGLIECKVWGILKDETNDAYTVCSWGAFPYKLDSSNDECYSIFKKSVIRLQKIKRVKLSLPS